MSAKNTIRRVNQCLSLILLFTLVSCNLPKTTVETQEPVIIQNPGNINVNENQWYVAVDGNDNNNCHTLANACQHITTAVERAADGDTVHIGAGTFIENIHVTKSLTFLGQGIDVTILDANGKQTLDGGFWFDGASRLQDPISASISGMTIQNGYSLTESGKSGAWNDSSGGGILAVNSNLEISNARITNNTAFHGGGIYFIGVVGGAVDLKLNIRNSSIDGNTAYGDGGGIFVAGLTNIEDSVFSNNIMKNPNGKGAALYVHSNATLLRDTIENNNSTYGGAIYSHAYKTGYGPDGLIKVQDSVIKDNFATGIQLADGEIYNSTISGNMGSGIELQGDLYIENSTVSNNHSNLSLVAGIVVWTVNAKLRTNHVTIAYNAIPGLLQGENGQSEFMNTLIAQNSVNCSFSNNSSPDSGINGSYNLATDGTCGAHFTVVHDALIGPLQNNGGPTMTHALLFGSPAIDAGRDGLDLDQRGVSRPQDGDGDGKKHVDIGAYEYERAANQVIFIPNRSLNCRSGPSAAYQVIGYADQDHSYAVEGRNEDSSWLYIRQTGDLRCWVGAGNGALSGEVAKVEVVNVAPVTPMDIITDTPAACSSFTAANCPSYCRIGRDPSGAQVCVNP